MQGTVILIFCYSDVVQDSLLGMSINNVTFCRLQEESASISERIYWSEKGLSGYFLDAAKATAQCKEIRIPESGKFCLRNPELPGLWNRKYSSRNLESSTRNPESSNWNPEFTAWNEESKTALDFLTCGDLAFKYLDKMRDCFVWIMRFTPFEIFDKKF